MAQREVAWSRRAAIQLLDILSWWIAKTGSDTYSQKLEKQIWQTIERLVQFPESGRKLDGTNKRYTAVGVYQIIYTFSETSLEILLIWDSRRDLESLRV